jgi:DNA repair protein RecN (Recombination protein N)
VLEEVRISALGVIDDAVLELAPGFTVVTGETGAGKTMVVQGLSLLTGARGDGGAVRNGASRAVVEARLLLDADSDVAERARDAGADLDEPDGNVAGGPAGTADPAVLLVTRMLSAEGRSRAFLGGRGVPLGILADLVGSQVALHGQSGQIRLLRPSEQRAALDRFAGAAVLEPLADYTRRYARLLAVRREISTRVERERERAAEAELLRLGLAEVERIAPEPGEDVGLRTELERLGHAETLAGAAAGAQQILAGGDGVDGADERGGTPVLTALALARRQLAAGESHDPELAALAARLDELAVLASELSGDLASYAAGVEQDPARLAAAAERAAALARLCRTHDTDVDGVLAWAERAGLRLLELDGDTDRRSELEREEQTLVGELRDLAATVAVARRAAADELGRKVSGELSNLAMARAEVTVRVSAHDDPEGLDVDPGDGSGSRPLAFGPTGVDEVELLLAAHAGATPRPLARGASGGELSRVMLALEVVLADAASGPAPATMVFDEVDAGVGGQAAVEVGRRLALLARHRQVICVTHLPQVAAFADQHLAVQKADDGRVTTSGVRRLDDRGRVRELSRMLAGRQESRLAQGHAEELLGEAARSKAS